MDIATSRTLRRSCIGVMLITIASLIGFSAWRVGPTLYEYRAVHALIEAVKRNDHDLDKPVKAVRRINACKAAIPALVDLLKEESSDFFTYLRAGEALEMI